MHVRDALPGALGDEAVHLHIVDLVVIEPGAVGRHAGGRIGGLDLVDDGVEAVRHIDQPLDRFARGAPLFAGGQRRPLALQVLKQFETFGRAGILRQPLLCGGAALLQGGVNFLQLLLQGGRGPETQGFVGIGFAHAAWAVISRQVNGKMVDLGVEIAIQLEHPVPAAQPAVEQVELLGIERAGIGQVQHQDMQVAPFRSCNRTRLRRKPAGAADGSPRFRRCDKDCAAAARVSRLPADSVSRAISATGQRCGWRAG